jgi:hypothetical protein
LPLNVIDVAMPYTPRRWTQATPRPKCIVVAAPDVPSFDLGDWERTASRK